MVVAATVHSRIMVLVVVVVVVVVVMVLQHHIPRPRRNLPPTTYHPPPTVHRHETGLDEPASARRGPFPSLLAARTGC